jgi:hypothetical protein
MGKPLPQSVSFLAGFGSSVAHVMGSYDEKLVKSNKPSHTINTVGVEIEEAQAE